MKKFMMLAVAIAALFVLGCSGGNAEPVEVVQAAPVVKEVIKHDTVRVTETEYIVPGPFKSAGKDSTSFQFGGTGYLEYEVRYDGPHLAIWPTKEMTGGTYLAGDVKSSLKVKLVNSTLTSTKPEELLAALHGNLVTVTGAMECTGRGEGSKNTFRSVEIFIHPRWQAEGRWPAEGE